MKPICVENLSFSYIKNRQVLNNISFRIEDSAVTAILGPNGCGKTSLLKLILGLIKKSSGSIKIFGKELDEIPLNERAKIIAYVPQSHKSIFAYKVIDVVAMGKLPYSGIMCINTDHDYIEAEEILVDMGISRLKDCEFTKLSGGEQQLVMISRALLQKAKILILDEPVTALDYGNQILILKKMRELSQKGVTCLMTTHYPEHALWISDNSILLKDGEIVDFGKSIEVITNENLLKIYNARINVINTEIDGRNMLSCIPLI